MSTDIKKLTKRQIKVLDGLFAGEEESAILKRCRVKGLTYGKWQMEDNFTLEFERRLRALNRQVELIIARYSSLAAAKLVELTGCENYETARKACLDIISLPFSKNGGKDSHRVEQSDYDQVISKEKAQKILQFLAYEAEQNKD